MLTTLLPELISLILSFSSIGALFNLSQVNKKFYTKLKEEIPWKSACLSFWKENQFQTGNLSSLETIVKEAVLICPSKSWKWFAKCFMVDIRTEKQAYNGCAYTVKVWTHERWIEIGDMKNSRLDGFGIQVVLSSPKLVLGDCVGGRVVGIATAIWDTGRYHGGMDFIKKGFGTFLWKSGASFEGEWINDNMDTGILSNNIMPF